MQIARNRHRLLTGLPASEWSRCARISVGQTNIVSLLMQICWKWRKVVTAEAQRSNFRAFLDGVQYSRTGILRYERIFGPGFVSTGGLETTKVSVALPGLPRPALSCPVT